MDFLIIVAENELKLLSKSRRGPLGASLYKGVCVTRNGKWRSVIYINGRQRYLGVFKTEVEAAKVYDTAAREYFVEPKDINFPYT